MESHPKDRLLRDINRHTIFSKYFGPSLQQRIDTPHWFENRFIRASLRGTGWIEKHERLLRDAGIEEVSNSYKIFSELDGNDSDYDLKIFDVLAEVRLVNWAKKNGYTNIEKLVPRGEPTPEFLLYQNGILTVAEAKHFRERDFLPEFIEDRLQGLVLSTGYLAQFGIFIHTTHKYDLERQDLLRKRRQNEQEYRCSIREELTEEWLMGMARILAPGNTELQRSVIQSAYAEIVPRAEQWMRGMREAFGVTELRVEKNLLTTTEHEVLRLAAEGLSNREIAERLDIAIGTVRVHLKDIRRRIGVATREEAVAAFGESTERERVPISILRLPRPPSVTAAPYERRATGLLPF